MKRNLIRLAFAVLLATEGSLHAAVNNPGLFSTGIDNQGHLIAAGSADPHYTLIQDPDPNFPGPSAFITTATPGPWLPNGPNSQWIAPSPNQVTDPCCAAAATYIYRTSFDLTGIDPGTVVIMGEWTSDNNTVDILINGQSTGLTTPFDGYGSLSHPFTISTGFVSGVNTLDFVVFNGGSGESSTGLRVEFPSCPMPTGEQFQVNTTTGIASLISGMLMSGWESIPNSAGTLTGYVFTEQLQGGNFVGITCPMGQCLKEVLTDLPSDCPVPPSPFAGSTWPIDSNNMFADEVLLSVSNIFANQGSLPSSTASCSLVTYQQMQIYCPDTGMYENYGPVNQIAFTIYKTRVSFSRAGVGASKRCSAASGCLP